MELPFKKSRKQAGFTAQAAAEQLHIDKRSLYRIEAGQQPAPPELVWHMAELYGDPGLVRWQQSEADPIGRRVNPPVLNAIVNSPQAVHYCLVRELDEAVPAADMLCRLVTNKMTQYDFNEHEKSQYFALYGKCVSNIKQAVAEVEGVMMRIFGVRAAEAAGKAHRDKMLQKGYLQTKEKALPKEGAQEKTSYQSLTPSSWQVKETRSEYMAAI
ncbi:helix-turn-helix domain-containing protein [Desulfallas thermosapovorans]|uniref:Helix-turn-helix protein n=1 Tax=Desulfallas thermosapovorans DSM 6562 TaxID=1121431 RepID=A0A5S4ZPV8_9FIRM|nr:helix-turn-helix transcriptional regulator [Desulfallas thermosapovorans]TYO94870.1 helix-turn-helix protein [Desulfallas thermosapovorans DSM 6562]